MASTRIFIGDCAYTTTKALTEILSNYLVQSTSIPKNPLTGRPVGYALVDFSTISEAERALTELSKKDVLVRIVPIARKLELDQSGKAANKGEASGVGIAGLKDMRDIIFTLYAIAKFYIDEIHHVLAHCTGVWISESELSAAIQGWRATQQPGSWPDHVHEESEEDKGVRLCLCGDKYRDLVLHVENGH